MIPDIEYEQYVYECMSEMKPIEFHKYKVLSKDEENEIINLTKLPTKYTIHDLDKECDRLFSCKLGYYKHRLFFLLHFTDHSLGMIECPENCDKCYKSLKEE